MQKYVAGFAFSKDKETVLLIGKTKPSWQAGLLNGIGGKVEVGESNHTAMVREFEEETGLVINDWEFTVSLGNSNYGVSFFRAFDDCIFDFEQPEEERPVLVGVHNLYNFSTINNLRWLIPLSLDEDVFKPLAVWDRGEN